MANPTPPEPQAAATPEAIIRRAAALMRERALAAALPENSHPWGDRRLPPATTPERYAEDMRGYLGGAWGDLAATWHPEVVLSVAHLLDQAWEGWPSYKHTSIGQRCLAIARAYRGDAA